MSAYASQEHQIQNRGSVLGLDSSSIEIEHGNTYKGKILEDRFLAVGNEENLRGSACTNTSVLVQAKIEHDSQGAMR
jgi:hypothetical protein